MNELHLAEKLISGWLA
jgi:hypothetical protein